MNNEAKVFTLDEARTMLPWLMEATREAEQKVNAVRKNKTQSPEAREALRQIIQHWAETVFKLGALPKQPFTVDFDNGQDYFCWEYPEKNIIYRHGYHDGYMGRHRIEES